MTTTDPADDPFGLHRWRFEIGCTYDCMVQEEEALRIEIVGLTRPAAVRSLRRIADWLEAGEADADGSISDGSATVTILAGAHPWIAAVLAHLAADRIERLGFPSRNETIIALDLDELAYEAFHCSLEGLTEAEVEQRMRALRVNRL